MKTRLQSFIASRPRVLHLALAGLSAWLPNTTGAADLSLATSPLFLATDAPANIVFIVDDSGSMDWEVMSKDYSNDGRFTGTQPDGTSPSGSGSIVNRSGCSISSGTFYGYIYGVKSSKATYSGDCNVAADTEWRFRNYQFNPLYFNPNKTYTPWPGVDSAGNYFANMPVTAARLDPYDASSPTINLIASDALGNTSSSTSSTTTTTTTSSGGWDSSGGWGGRWGSSSGDSSGGWDSSGSSTTTTSSSTTSGGSTTTYDGFRYYVWTDSNGNGKYDDTDTRTEYLVKNQSAAVQQNFANWFSYYRSRMLVAKAAFGKVIEQYSGVRMGLIAINNNNSNNRAVALMNSDTTTGNKRALLDDLYSIKAANGTPLQTALYNCGNYLSCATGNIFGSCPALSSSAGGECQQNFAIMMTDGFYNGSAPSVGNTDGDGNTSYDGGAYADSYSNTLGDIAMKFYENDINTSLANNVPTTEGVDEASHQHMVTYTVSFGLTGSLTTEPTSPTTAFPWPNPSGSDAAKIDDLQHAAYNGRGLYLSAQDPDALVSALTTTVGDIIERTSSFSAVALNSTTLNSDSKIYQSAFDPTDWSGQLLYRPVSTSGVVGSATIDAAELLDARNYSTRTIITMKSDTNAGVPFRWDSLSAAQQAALNKGPITGATDTYGDERLDYLRGNRDLETDNDGVFRTRGSRLGDIVNSAPVYVGRPGFNYTFNDYKTFRASKKNRTTMVYVGANDGMLHGFDAVTGEEKLAYVPKSVYTYLNQLGSTSYSHRYYVDGTPTVGDIFDGSTWRTVLVSGLGGGGQGVFALNVTDPDSFSEANAANIVLWEFTDANDSDLGYTYSQPSIVKLRDGTWAAIFGNGYNNTASDSNASSTGNAVLYVVNAKTGGLIKKISTGWGKSQDPTGASRPNGLASPAAVDVDGDSIVDYVYAGDLFGNLWRFDFTATSSSGWGISYSGTPLFKARSASNVAQPITTRPTVGRHPTQANSYMVYFGTGKYLETGDNSATSQTTQTFYGIWDKNLATLTTFTRTNLLAQQITSQTSTGRVTTDNTINWASHVGWYIDLYNTAGGNTNNYGERQISSAVLRGTTGSGRIIFTTMLPSTDACDFGGSGWLMMLDANDGSRLSFTAFDMNGDGQFTSADNISSTPPSGLKTTGIGLQPAVAYDASKNSEVAFVNTTETGASSATGSASGIDAPSLSGGNPPQGRITWRRLR